jgi:ArsR family transcriptional regulator
MKWIVDTMKHQSEILSVAERLEALGNETRLSVFHLLVSAGESGLTVGEVQRELVVAASTLTHHIQRLAAVGLVTQTREGRRLLCRANFSEMHHLVDFLTRNCCALDHTSATVEEAA